MKKTKKHSKAKRIIIKSIIIFLCVVVFLGALFLALYPFISNYVNDKYQSEIRTEYKQKIEKTNASILEEEWAKAEAYNQTLLSVRYSDEALDYAGDEYIDLLNVTGNGIMCYVEIPLLNVNIPVYHGTDGAVLEQGAGHLFGSSLPVGGEGCHAVITGHSGVASKTLFSDLDKLGIGDVFYLHTLDRTLAYKVTEINTVLPWEVDVLGEYKGQDLCTLITCTPYGVNTHRLLVTGSRIPYEEAEEIVEQENDNNGNVGSTWKEQYMLGLAVGGGCVLFLVLVLIIILIIKRKRRKEREERKRQRKEREQQEQSEEQPDSGEQAQDNEQKPQKQESEDP